MTASRSGRFDAAVVGAGMAGLPLALKFAHNGFRVALIEREEIGGTCLNRGCIPSKAMLASARVAHQVRHAAGWGVSAPEPRVDLGEVVRRKDALVASVRRGAERNVAANEKLALIRGEARFEDARALRVGERLVQADRVFINTGAGPVLPDIPGLAEVPHLDSTSAMNLDELPGELVVLGGGYVGVEFAQMYRRFGSEVTLVQRARQLLPREDADIAQALQAVLEAEGVRVLLGAVPRELRQLHGEIQVLLEQDGRESSVKGTHLLLATGRRPNPAALNLENAGIAPLSSGFIPVNERLETSAAGVWALGDVRGGPMFTHTARDDARIVYENVVKGAGLSIAGRVVPYAVFTDPQLGRVGATEAEARASGARVKVGRYEGKRVAKARAMGEPAGLIKIVADGESDRILGASVLLAEGAEIVHTLVAAMQLGARYTDLADMIHIHPTLAEGLSSALGGVHYEEGL